MWLVGEVDNHVAIYGSRVAEGFSAFQRRSCIRYYQLRSPPYLVNKTVKILYPVTSHQCSILHWGLNKMGDILQMSFSNAFSWKKIFVFWLKFHWNLFLMVHLTASQYWFRWWLGTSQVTSHYLNQCWLRCLTPFSLCTVVHYVHDMFPEHHQDSLAICW